MRPSSAAPVVAAAVFVFAVLPAVAFGLTLQPDQIAGHAAHDRWLGESTVALLAATPAEEASDPRLDQPTAVHHVVAEGDTLATIAAAHGFDEIDDWRLLFDANPHIEHPDLIVPGSRVRIPAPGEQPEERELPAPVAAAVQAGAASGGDVWRRLAACESGGRNVVSSNGLYYGYFQFLPSTWHSVGGTGLPTEHSYAEQLHRAQLLQARAGWGQWPACARALGLR